MATRRSAIASEPPTFIKPQLCRPLDQAPATDRWAHEIKFDGYRMAARLHGGSVKLLTRTGLDWTSRYRAVAGALAQLPVSSAYLDGELCAVEPDGVTSFARLQAATDAGTTDQLVFYLFDALHIDGADLMGRPLLDRKAALERLLAGRTGTLQYSEHTIGNGPAFHAEACRLKLEGIISKRIDAAYAPGDRGVWVKAKCLNREEFVVVGWTDPEGTRPHLGALLLGYYDPAGTLRYAGRVGTGMTDQVLADLRRRLDDLAADRMPLDQPPPRRSRFGGALQLSRVHWVRPELVVEVRYLSWTSDGLLRQVIFEGVREDKPARQVVRGDVG